MNSISIIYKTIERESPTYPWDLILLNNDLSKSLTIDLNDLNIPIFPRMHMGCIID